MHLTKRSRASVLIVTVVVSALLGSSLSGVAGATESSAAVLPRAARAKVSSAALSKAGLSRLIPLTSYEPNDDIASATPIPASPVEDTLDASSDAADVYRIDLAAGQRLGLAIIGDAALDADVYVFGPGTSSIGDGARLAWTVGDAFPKATSYDVLPSLGGTYYVAVVAASGAGAYQLRYDVVATPAGPDDDIPGVAVGALPAHIAETVEALSDTDDVWEVPLSEGERISAQLAGPADADLDLLIFGPSASSVHGVLPIAGSSGAASNEGVLFDARVGQAGTYYVCVRAARGGGPYTLDIDVAPYPSTTWEDRSSAAPLGNTVGGSRWDTLSRVSDANDFWSVYLTAGQRLELTLNGAVGTDFDVYVYDASSTEPIAWANDTVYPERVVVDATISGTFYVEVVAFSGTGGYSLTWSLGDTPVFLGTTRAWGQNRYETAVDVSERTFEPDSVRTVVLATGASFADAMAAAGLAGCFRAPVLLTDPRSVPPAVLAEIERVGASEVVIVGGEGAVFPSVVNTLRGAGLSVRRVWGGDRYATAAAVAREMARLLGDDFSREAFVVRGDVFADAVGVSAVAYAKGMPVLLTRTTTLPDATRAAIDELDCTDIYIAGGTGAVSDGVKALLQARPSVERPIVRLAGADRYATAASVADYAVRRYWCSPAFVGMATGVTFPDALTGGAASGARGGVLLLTSPTTLSSPASNFLRAQKGQVLAVQVFGGAGAVSDTVRAQIDAALR